MPVVDSPSESPQFIRFRTEAEVLARLNDPDVPTIYEIGSHRDLPYCTREFVEGSNLEQLASARTLQFDEGVRVLARVARTVQRIHDCGIVHQNLHASNIIVTAGGAPKLIGFGLSGMLDSMPHATAETAAEIDVRALKKLVDWLGTALDQPIPPRLDALRQSGSVHSAAAIADALDSFCREQRPPRPWWHFW
jgi:serine/threonine protein kinase